MTDFGFIFFFLMGIFGLGYVTIILMYTIGWFNLKPFFQSESIPGIRVSIIIPCRNEEANIIDLLNDIYSQTYPRNLVEVIVADDNSEDSSVQLVNEFILNHTSMQIRLISISDDGINTAYKKNAINQAIEVAQGDLMITTDADCRMGKDWLMSIASYYHEKKFKMIVGPVSFHNEKSAFEKMQTVEFLSLIGITAGAISIGKPIMCNGANLAYEKQAFHAVGGFGNDSFSSGDDVFLLLKIKKMFGNKSIGFLKNKNAFVFTEAKSTLTEFLHQRTRWASKNKGYDLNILMVSFTVFMMNFLMVLGLLMTIFNIEILSTISILFFIKLLLELPILLGILHFANRSRLLLTAAPLVFLYPVYIILTGTMGIISTYKWKGRTVKR